MSYDLDGIFQSRGQGALVTSVPKIQNQILRTPGLQQITSKGAKALTTRQARPMQHPGYSPGMVSGMGEINIPFIGPVSNTTLIIGVAGLALGAFLLFGRK